MYFIVQNSRNLKEAFDLIFADKRLLHFQNFSRRKSAFADSCEEGKVYFNQAVTVCQLRRI